MSARVLVTGATGYVGGRLVTKLLADGYDVRVLARSAARAQRHSWSDDVDLVVGDVLDAASLPAAFEGCDAAYHLVHSMGSGRDFADDEARAAEHVRDAAAAAGLRRLVYLGGMGDADTGDGLSAHLASRRRVGQILASGATPVTELRAAVIIGSGSLSFEMLRYLTEVLPIMVTPSWVRTRCQPIAIRDVLHYLTAALDDPSDDDHVFDIGGPDVLTYAEMMRTYAQVAGLPRRLIVPVPVLSPRLSSHWIGLVTPLPARTARPLVDSLRHEVVVDPERSIHEFAPHEPLSFRRAIELALRRTGAGGVDTRWTDAGFSPAEPIPGDPEWAGGTTLVDHQSVETTAPPDALFRAFSRIGGANGYYVAGWAWWLRGLADRVIGGPGLRRGRRHPTELRVGESLDFWRVVDVADMADGERLVLQAEMKVPGTAWLSWHVTPGARQGAVLHQEAVFAPKGLFGRLYWYAMLPFHWLIFRRMAHAIARHAENDRSDAPESVGT